MGTHVEGALQSSLDGAVAGMDEQLRALDGAFGDVFGASFGGAFGGGGGGGSGGGGDAADDSRPDPSKALRGRAIPVTHDGGRTSPPASPSRPEIINL